MGYGVVVCTKCREHAQITELDSSKTIKCKRCNATLYTKRLRILFTSKELSEAISARTHIQARIVEKKKHIGTSVNNKGSEQKYSVFGKDMDDSKACSINSRKIPAATKKTAEVIREILYQNNKLMSYEKLKEMALERDVPERKFEEMLTRLFLAGEIYSPSKGYVKIV